MTEQKTSTKKRGKTLAVLAVVLVIGVIIIANLRSQRERTVKVTIDKVVRQDLNSIVSASGEIKPKKNVNISAQVPGRIVLIGVVEGQEVRAGDFLLKLDSTQYEANADRDRYFIRSANAELIQAEARLQRDKSSYQRLLRLFEEDLISKEELEAAKAQFDVSTAQVNAIGFQIKQAEASLQSTLDNLKKTTFDSPIDGIITSLRVEEGEVAIIGTMNNPGTVLMTIADLSVMEVEVEVDETDVVGVAIGQVADIRVDAYPETTFKGRVTEVGSSALQRVTGGASTQESKDFKVVITLEDPAKSLKPGLSASSDIIVAEKKGVLTVPISALVLRDRETAEGDVPSARTEEEGVYVVRDGRAAFVPVEKGVMGGMMIEVLSGLEEGQEIVSGPYAALRELKDGTLLKAEERKDTPVR